MSFFDFGDKDLVKDQINRKIDPIIYSDDNPQLYIISDYYLTRNEIMKLKSLICEKLKLYSISLKVIFPFKFLPSEKESSKQISNFYRENSIDLSKYIPFNSKIVTIGRASNAITYNTDVSVDCFYDIVFNYSNFYSSLLKSWIFPIDHWFYFWGKNNWKNYFAFHQFKSAIEYNPVLERQKNLIIEIVEDPNKFLEENMDEKEVAWDIETDGFNFMSNRIGCITMSFDGIKGYYLDWYKINKDILNKFFKNKFQIGANLKFDCKFLKSKGIDSVKIDFDIVSAGHVLNEMRSNSLKTLSWLYTQYGGYEQELDDYMKRYRGTGNYLNIPKEILSKYATMDAIITFQIYKKMIVQFNKIDKIFYGENERWKLSNYYFEIVNPSLNLFTEIEYEGVYIDWDKVREVGVIFQNRIEGIKDQIYKSLEKDRSDFNIDSNPQLGRVLKEKGWPVYGISKTGDLLLNEDTLTEYENEGYEIATLIKNLHSLNTLYKTFVGKEEDKSGYWQYRYLDNKIHPNFGVMFTDSGRNRCKDPNLQNIPKRGDEEDSKLIRSYFSPPSKDYYILSLDFSGFQLRIGAILSGDEEMKKAFTELGGDLHSVTAATVLMNNKVSIEEFISRKKEKEFKDMRFKSKGVNFSLEFGTSGISFAESSLLKEWSIDEVEKYLIENRITNRPYELKKSEVAISRNLDLKFCKYWAVANDIKRKFFEKYSGLKKWIDESIKFAEDYGYIKSSFGAIRRLPQLLYKGDGKDREIKNLQNISLNSPVQNFEACIVNMTLIEINNWLRENNMKSKIFTTVHDSMDVYVHKNELKPVLEKFKEVSERNRIENKNIPIEIEWDVADYYNRKEVWGFGKEIKLYEL